MLAFGPTQVLQYGSQWSIAALSVVSKERLEIGGQRYPGEEPGVQHWTNMNTPQVCPCRWIITRSLIREESHQGGLEPEAQFVAYGWADVPAPGRSPLVAVRDLAAELFAERAGRQERIRIVEEVRRGVEMRIMVDGADLVVLGRVPIYPGIGEPARA